MVLGKRLGVEGGKKNRPNN